MAQMAMVSSIATTSFDSNPFFFTNSASYHLHHFYSFPRKQSFTFTLARTGKNFTCFCTNYDESSLRSATADQSVAVDDDVDQLSVGYGGLEIEIKKIGKNSRRIKSSISINASLVTLWNLLTDYERLADFIPSLAVSQLLQKSDGFARLYQVGEQNLAFGLKFNAKGVLDCYEKDLEEFSYGQKRDIEFNMIEGDFQLFEGRWSIEQKLIEQYNSDLFEGNNSLSSPSPSPSGQEYKTTLTYMVDVKPKMWLPVRLVEGRLSRDIKMNLSCIKAAAQKASQVDIRTA